jgi:hypothetical protein
LSGSVNLFVYVKSERFEEAGRQLQVGLLIAHGDDMDDHRVRTMGIIMIALMIYPAMLTAAAPHDIFAKPCSLSRTKDAAALRTFTALDCGCGPVVVTHPASFIGHVVITNEEEALAYVRLFSLPDNWSMFTGLGNMVEVQVDTGRDASAFTVASQETFTKHGLFAPRVSKYDVASWHGYLVQRVVVRPDQRVYEVSEFVRGDGFYQLLRERVLIEDATEIGVIFIGNA